MSKVIKNARVLGKRVWCLDCLEKTPLKISLADWLVPVRTDPYKLTIDSSDIDRRVIGICSECLKEKNDFQRSNIEKVSFNHPNLVLRPI